MDGKSSPGQAAHDAWCADDDWADLSDTERAAWEEAGQAAIDWWHADRGLESPREITVEMNLGDAPEAYKAYVERLLEPIRGEMARLRSHLR